MTKKILISLFFVIAFVLFLSFTNKVSALTFNYNNNDVVLPDYDSLLEKHKADCAVIFYHKVKNYYELYILRSHDSTDFYSIIPRYNAPTYTLSPYWEYHLNTSSNSWDFYHYSDNLYSGGISVGENSSYEIVYSNVDIKDKNGDIAFAGASSTDVPDKFFNFRHGTLDYSINLTANNNNIVLWNNIAVFQANNILLIYTSQERPTYRYSNYKHYLTTTGVTTIYGYDLKTDTVIADETITKFSKTGMDVAFDKSQLIYSNFVLFDEKMHPIFLTTGDYLGDEDMKRHCFRQYFCWWSLF